MLSLKEKVTQKLSRLLGDSPSQPYDSPKANYSKGSNTYTSYFSFKNPSITKDDPVPMQSDGDFEPLQSASSLDEYESPVTARSTSMSDIFEDATEPQSTWNRMPNLTEESSLIYVDLYEFLQLSLPTIVKGCQWILLYSTLRDGISLRTLIRKSADLSGPGLLIVRDRKGAIFGGLLDCPLKPCPKRKYQGAIQSFVFTTRYGAPRLFRATGANRYFYLCLNDLLAFGGGGNFAMSLDEDLLTGSSGPCDTFGNSCLAHDPEFELKNVELWGFAHVSRYVT